MENPWWVLGPWILHCLISCRAPPKTLVMAPRCRGTPWQGRCRNYSKGGVDAIDDTCHLSKRTKKLGVKLLEMLTIERVGEKPSVRSLQAVSIDLWNADDLVRSFPFWRELVELSLVREFVPSLLGPVSRETGPWCCRVVKTTRGFVRTEFRLSTGACDRNPCG